jgi:hypothetical protein
MMTLTGGKLTGKSEIKNPKSEMRSENRVPMLCAKLQISD